MVRIVCVSDTHTQFGKVLKYLPGGDILIHAGDISDCGDMKDLWEFCQQVKTIRHKYKDVVICAGNHDFNFENNYRSISELALKDAGIIYLHDSFTVSCGLKIYGSPFTPEFCSWAFNLHRGKPLADKWALIPDDVNILLTHGPPLGILDQVETFGTDAEYTYEKVGCEDLLNRVKQLKNLKLHVFGHIHEQEKEVEVIGNTTFVNAAQVDNHNRLIKKPIVVEI